MINLYRCKYKGLTGHLLQWVAATVASYAQKLCLYKMPEKSRVVFTFFHYWNRCKGLKEVDCTRGQYSQSVGFCISLKCGKFLSLPVCCYNWKWLLLTVDRPNKPFRIMVMSRESWGPVFSRKEIMNSCSSLARFTTSLRSRGLFWEVARIWALSYAWVFSEIGQYPSLWE